MSITVRPSSEAPPIHWATAEEARAHFDRQARYWLGISGEQFLEKWDAGAYKGGEDLAVRQVAILIPLVR